MECYKGLSYLYDTIMSDIDYCRWADYICRIFKAENVNPNIVLDLGCGSGSLTIEMSKRGYEMIGVDISEDMLSIAKNKALELNQNIIFLQQDMTNFKLYGSVGAVISSMDCINYITSEKKLLKLFETVNYYLEDGGLFIFDINSEYKLSEVLGNNIFTYDNGDIFYVWESSYNKNNKICEYFLTFFKKIEENYKRIDEYHKQRAYTLTEIKNMLSQANLKLLHIFHDRTFQPPRKNTERVFFVVGK